MNLYASSTNKSSTKIVKLSTASLKEYSFFF